MTSTVRLVWLLNLRRAARDAVLVASLSTPPERTPPGTFLMYTFGPIVVIVLLPALFFISVKLGIGKHVETVRWLRLSQREDKPARVIHRQLMHSLVPLLPLFKSLADHPADHGGGAYSGHAGSRLARRGGSNVRS